MIFERLILELFSNYYFLLAFMAGFVIGDVVIILGMLAGANKIQFWPIILFAFIGGICHDILYYYISNSRFGYFIKKKFKLSKKKSKMAQYIEKLSGESYFLPVLIAKFIYGVRDAVILYISHNNKNFKKYILITSSTELIWLLTVTSIGWLAGRGFTQILYLFKGVEKLTLFIILLLVVYYLIIKVFVFITMKKIKKVVNKRRSN